MKHARAKAGKGWVIRNDATLLSDFNDRINDHALFVGWFDYAAAGLPLPIEAQVFQAWYFACYPEKLDPSYPIEGIERTFNDMRPLSRKRRKSVLRRKIEWAKRQADVMRDERTDRRPLILNGEIDVTV